LNNLSGRHRLLPRSRCENLDLVPVQIQPAEGPRRGRLFFSPT
jgi:hypothetical protein